MTAVHYVMLVKCPDTLGVVAAVSGFLAENRCSIGESHQFLDEQTGRFFMRITFAPEAAEEFDLAGLGERLAAVAERFRIDFRLFDPAIRPRVLIAVSRFGHCLFDLLHRWRAGILPVDIVGVVSNHDAMRSFVEWSGLPYYHLPVDNADKRPQEQQFLKLAADLQVDLVVLARYMQILSEEMCEALSERCINIHHSFLPSFKGARPYHQAHARGVKIIGATAHYVTTDLDEGPIIEQGVERVSHARSADDLVTIGRDIECAVLARAVTWHVEHRVCLNGQRTVVFS
ncbi:formyltetrahydrofolate deformylase [Sphingomonas sp. ZT3P38]|uniref:formyltetrahydrofolate deformylase n=1 Tax=Parasphingomonas zepuensis TaxID=3096161 RepID=UPI002FC9141C